ncbi:hypothetical protein ZWY2020_014810 [Hordeum vulgare]|nr:hypothetical protein ZWY2020_014810 [Hordeum vulgare]
MQWLDGKAPSSVVYVSFGSSIVHADLKQVVEIGLGLEASGHPFICVVSSSPKKADQDTDQEVDRFLEELEARVAGILDRGLVALFWSSPMHRWAAS